MTFMTVTQGLLQGFGVTLLLFVLTLIFSLPLGLLISTFTMSKCTPIRVFFKVIVWIVRGVPLMLQLFIVYYLPGMISKAGSNFWGTLDNSFYFDYGIKNGGSFLATVVAFAFNYACYFSEIFRGGIEGIPQGQIEAGQVLGMTNRQIFFKITFMQVVKRILAPMSNEIITLVKDTALARVIGVVEIVMSAYIFTSKALIWPLFYSGAFYLHVVGLLTLLFNYLEKKFSYYRV